MTGELLGFEGVHVTEALEVLAVVRRPDGERVFVNAATLRRRIRRLAVFGEPTEASEAALAAIETEEKRRGLRRPRTIEGERR